MKLGKANVLRFTPFSRIPIQCIVNFHWQGRFQSSFSLPTFDFPVRCSSSFLGIYLGLRWTLQTSPVRTFSTSPVRAFSISPKRAFLTFPKYAVSSVVFVLPFQNIFSFRSTCIRLCKKNYRVGIYMSGYQSGGSRKTRFRRWFLRLCPKGN